MDEAQRIADEHDILKLANAYSHAVMRRDGALAARTYAQDGQLIAFGRPPIVGRAALAAAFTATFSPLAFITQACVGHVIEVEGDRASASFSVNEFFRPQAAQGDMLMCCMGVYEDEVVRTGDGWRFAQRRFSPFFRGTATMPGKVSEAPTFEKDVSSWRPFRGG
jgi:roadblock/LC7 domain-containing protein